MKFQPGDETVVAGMVDGLVSISRREDDLKPTKQERRKVSYRYIPNEFHPKSIDTVVHEEKRDLTSKYDASLRKFEYSKALDRVLMPFVANKTPQVTVGLFQELIR